MTRYVAIHDRKPKVTSDWWADDRQGPSTISVIVSDDSPIATGLYDASGTLLYRIEDRFPCGFTRSKKDD